MITFQQQHNTGDVGSCLGMGMDLRGEMLKANDHVGHDENCGNNSSCIIRVLLTKLHEYPGYIKGGVVSEGPAALFWYLSHQYRGDAVFKASKEDWMCYQELFFHGIGVLDLAPKSEPDLLRKLGLAVFDGSEFASLARLDREDGRSGIWFSTTGGQGVGELVSLIVEGLYIHVKGHADCGLHCLKFSGNMRFHALWVDKTIPNAVKREVAVTDDSLWTDIAAQCVDVLPQPYVLPDEVLIDSNKVDQDADICAFLDCVLDDLESDGLLSVPRVSYDRLLSVESDCDGVGKKFGECEPRVVIACSPDAHDGTWGFCYENLFDSEGVAVLREFDEAKPYLTRAHYDWADAKGIGDTFKSEVDCIVYSVDARTRKVLVHSALRMGSKVIWRALDRVIDWLPPVPVFMHFMTVPTISRELPFGIRIEGFKKFVKFRMKSTDVCWMKGSDRNLYASRAYGYYAVCMDSRDSNRLLRLGFSRSRVLRMGECMDIIDRDVSFMVMGSVLDSVNMYEEVLRLAIVRPRASFVYVRMDETDLFWRALCEFGVEEHCPTTELSLQHMLYDN